MTRLPLLAALLAVACGGSDPSAPAPLQCSQSARTGTYLFTYTTLGGDCGDIPPTVVVGGSPATGAGCTVTFERWSADQCSLERTGVCAQTDGTSFEMAVVSKQETTDGARLSGTATVILRDGSGAILCTGTYRLNATRQ